MQETIVGQEDGSREEYKKIYLWYSKAAFLE